MNRVFACTPSDLESFRAKYLSILDRFIGFGLAISREKMNEYMISTYINRLDTYQVDLDDVSIYWLFQAIGDVVDPDSTHYAIHHIIWQLVDAHERGVISLEHGLYESYKRVTADCQVLEE